MTPEHTSPELKAPSVAVDSTNNSVAPAAQPSEPTATQRPTEPKRQNSLKKKTTMERPLADIISEQFPSFDAESLIVRPFEDEAARDAKFEKDLSNMLLDVIIETHAWASARPKHEAAVESQKLEEQISHIIATEREQGMSSPAPSSSSSFFVSDSSRLGEFVRRMKTALAALTGGSPF
ncbi:hypothetical protein M413DRAFT_63680 [Hebeloma cylindrosporum]|uniref:Uncharacterized protein n=1 Tax=Hebeloma cylindrosporum TaxID=76867 RepID=A0A0C2Z116_HEBCY|nr:hypothetical protein M413DRAFT_63680 [Hebeloma cylindrosporum h7]